MKKINKKNKIKLIIFDHVKNNSKSYILVTLIFVIGIFLGIMFVNNSKEETIQETSNYFNSYILKIKEADDLKNSEMLKTSLFKNVGTGVCLWFLGTTVIRNTCSISRNFI